jgi:hypothetical protein
MQEKVMDVNHGLDSCTDEARHVFFSFGPSARAVIVDTPGLNNTYLDDREVLKRIVKWLDIS